jgi:MFS transporter, ENTS family, enterobactin (siderophore) exporter
MAAGSLLVDVSPLRENAVFRRLFVARTIMLFGVGMVSVTVPVHVFMATGSTVQVGVVTAAEGLAFFFGYIFGGVLADRTDRWRLILLCRVGSSASFIGLTLNAWLGGPIWLIGALVVLNGLSGATGITALLAVQPSLVDRSKLHAVGALNMLSLRLGTVLAPVAGGAVVAFAGPVWSYGFGALAALSTTTMLRRPDPSELPAAAPPPAGATPRENPWRALLAGYRHIARDRVVAGVMIAGVVGMIGGGSRVLIPALAEARFGHAPLVVGLMYSAVSAGMVAGALASGWIKRVLRPGRLLLWMMVLCFLCYAAAGASPFLALVLLFLLAAGAVNSVEEVLRYALLQLRTPPEFLGRVNSVFAAQNMSGVAVGALVAGIVGGWVDPVTAFWSYNLAMAGVSVLVLLLLPALRGHRGAESRPTRPAEENDECAGQ